MLIRNGKKYALTLCIGLALSVTAFAQKSGEIVEPSLADEFIDSSGIQVIELHRDNLDRVLGDLDENAAHQIRADLKNLRAEYGEPSSDRAICTNGPTANYNYGRWFANASGRYTYWANQNLFLEFGPAWCTANYAVWVVARNISGPLPAGYTHFKFNLRNVNTGANLGNLWVPASDTTWGAGVKVISVSAGNPANVNMLWKNDAYSPGVYDANVWIRNIIVLKL